MTVFPKDPLTGGNVEIIRRFRFQEPVIAMSVDLEDFFGDATEDGLDFLLDLFDEYGVLVTFFVLGKYAQLFPKKVRRVVRRGHEIASHSWTHVPLHRLQPKQLRDHLHKSFDTLSNLTGQAPKGFRAPIFSISTENFSVLQEIARAGFCYDSSIFPIRGPRYGIPRFPREPLELRVGDKSLLEFPLSTVSVGSVNLPVAGGGYFRLLPWRIFRSMVRLVQKDRIPFVFYCHPYEFQAGWLHLPSVPGLIGNVQSRAKEIKANLFRPYMRSRLRQLVESFKIVTFSSLLNEFKTS